MDKWNFSILFIKTSVSKEYPQHLQPYNIICFKMESTSLSKYKYTFFLIRLQYLFTSFSQRIAGCPGVIFSGAPTYFWCILLHFGQEGSCLCVFYFINTYNFFNVRKNDRCAVWGCDNDRRYNIKLLQEYLLLLEVKDSLHHQKLQLESEQ